MKPLILCLETATKVCSVGLFRGSELVSLKEVSAEQYVHSEQLSVLIASCIEEANESPDSINAVAISSGPGSYTGLRIGTSTAKGICFGQDIPLIAIETLDQLAYAALQRDSSYDNYLPMLDARRMEIFTSVFNKEGQKVKSTWAEIIDEHSFSELKGKKINIFGDGASKCLDQLGHLDVTLTELSCSARNMGDLALEFYQKEKFEDLAYFEPFYLKDFVAGKPKKLI